MFMLITDTDTLLSVHALNILLMSNFGLLTFPNYCFLYFICE